MVSVSTSLAALATPIANGFLGQQFRPKHDSEAPFLVRARGPR